ncbi:hypothetical protein T552_03255 [Pneumocystis carinii B80]|uniref:SIT4 phosphatase-associated protein n=1 Tax=Pneumocystis carinii (strain B80) TaxID=1408658 RepID=A0A0W4ZC70_PNEC8|nr:hypothetical protein T552_03255 [Pneumocystis carinii B80]KTW25981.1 hypothetical protein T552_03255 [Pneumocystis carinii B80]
MFWRLGGFGFANTSAIDSLLEKAPDVTLEEVLDEEELLQECKSHNPKLIEYLREPDVLHKLLRYIIREDLDEKAKQKYPYIAYEVLSCEIWSICETIMENKMLLFEFWEFLERPAPLDPLQASYFSKVNEQFFEKKTEEMILFIQSIPDIVFKILKHIETSAITDLLLKIISIEQNDLGVINWLQNESLIPYLLSKMNPHVDPSTQTAAADLLKDIISISSNPENQRNIGSNALLWELVSKESIEILVNFMFDTEGPFSSSSLINGASIIIELLRKNNSGYNRVSFFDISFAKNTSGEKGPIYFDNMLKILASHISDFQKILLNPRMPKDEIEVAFDKIKPLGVERFRICELYAELLHCSNMILLNKPKDNLKIMKKNKICDETKEKPQNTKIVRNLDISGNVETYEVFNTEQVFSWEDLSFKYIDSYEVLENKEHLLNKNSDIEDIFLENITKTKSSISEDNFDNYSSELNSKESETNNTLVEHLSNNNGLSKEDVESDENLDHFENNYDALNMPFQNNLSDEKHCTNINEIAAVYDNTDTIFEPEVSDYLKIQFIEHKVLSTLLNMFFVFPWNNFLHNVVYDIIQQVFNAPMDEKYCCALVLDLFSEGKICEKIIQGQKDNDDTISKPCGVRLGYMGHLTLIAEEVVKFTKRYSPHTISPIIAEKVLSTQWIDYIEHSLTETREKDNAILGGVRPHHLSLHSVIDFDDNGLQDFMSDVADIDYDDDDDDDDDDLNRRINLFGIQDTNDKHTITDMDDDSDFKHDQFSRYINQQSMDEFSNNYERPDNDKEDVSWIEENEAFKHNRITNDLSPSQYQEITDEKFDNRSLNDIFEQKIYTKYQDNYIDKNTIVDSFLILDEKQEKIDDNYDNFNGKSDLNSDSHIQDLDYRLFNSITISKQEIQDKYYNTTEKISEL